MGRCRKPPLKQLFRWFALAVEFLLASRSVRSFLPPGNTMGSSNCSLQPSLLAIGLELFRKAWWLIGVGGVTARAGRAGSATGTGVRAFSWLILMDLANPAGVLAKQALHWPIMAFPALGTYRPQCG